MQERVSVSRPGLTKESMTGALKSLGTLGALGVLIEEHQERAKNESRK